MVLFLAALTVGLFLAFNIMFVLFNLGYPGFLFAALLPAVALGGYVVWRWARGDNGIVAVVPGLLVMYVIMGLSIVAVTSLY
ncbi:hypothetical protein [Antarcticimicrobium luteum]|uniref:Uncharacterized protein n=1 Tax=Antarcticimicrobium luteum TaxID=2547397 RepID=A0A4R5VCR1_9RHOB|nr:hypothetical protein [Antarcticimicrobium luteum]TDK49864.1 hypothetical protein E1832_08260 [Antarcticimicrobium luteum]